MREDDRPPQQSRSIVLRQAVAPQVVVEWAEGEVRLHPTRHGRPRTARAAARGRWRRRARRGGQCQASARRCPRGPPAQTSTTRRRAAHARRAGSAPATTWRRACRSECLSMLTAAVHVRSMYKAAVQVAQCYGQTCANLDIAMLLRPLSSRKAPLLCCAKTPPLTHSANTTAFPSTTVEGRNTNVRRALRGRLPHHRHLALWYTTRARARKCRCC